MSSAEDNPKVYGNFDPDNTRPYITQVLKHFDAMLVEKFGKKKEDLHSMQTFAKTFLGQLQKSFEEFEGIADIDDHTKNEIIELIKLHKNW